MVLMQRHLGFRGEEKNPVDPLDAYKFERDLAILAQRACETRQLLPQQQSKSADGGRELSTRLEDVRQALLELYKRNLVKINHSAMELLCAKKLMELDCSRVLVEHSLKENLVCDTFGEKEGDGGTERLIVEIETGFVPPEYALEPATYNEARVASKIARYSTFASSFILGAPPTYVLNLPKIFLVKPAMRTLEDALVLKGLCDRYYKNPPVSLEEVMSAKLDSVFIIDVDRALVNEVPARQYAEEARRMTNALLS